ncbi:MAG: alpha/beta hydrolase [Myxococcales bacterium]|nr:alpha/beta hydrolase [Myxococcales bacterium]
MTALRPFHQHRFGDLPDEPRVPHPYFEATAREVEVASSDFGRVRIHLKEHGSGPPLLLVHGLMTSSYSFRYVLEPLGSRFRCIAVDLPGAGRSDKPDVAYGPEAMARLLAELIETLGIGPCRVLGNSMGGYVSMWLALRRPDLVSRLVSVHCPGVPLRRLQLLKAALSAPGAGRVLDWVVARDPERWAHKNVHYWDESLKSLEEAREYGAPLRTPEGRRAFARHLGDTLDVNDMARFVAELERAELPVPLQLLFVKKDPMVPPRVGRQLHALIPGAEMVWLEEASHFCHVDAPDRVVRAVMPFLLQGS